MAATVAVTRALFRLAIRGALDKAHGIQEAHRYALLRVADKSNVCAVGSFSGGCPAAQAGLWDVADADDELLFEPIRQFAYAFDDLWPAGTTRIVVND